MVVVLSYLAVHFKKQVDKISIWKTGFSPQFFSQYGEMINAVYKEILWFRRLQYCDEYLNRCTNQVKLLQLNLAVHQWKHNVLQCEWDETSVHISAVYFEWAIN